MGTASFQELEQIEPANAHEYRRRCLWMMSIEMAMARMYQDTEAEEQERAKIATAVASLERMQKEMHEAMERMERW